MSFLFYVNLSGVRLLSGLASQPLTILAPWVLLRVRWSITWLNGSTLGDCLPLFSGNREAELKLTTFSFTCFCLSSSLTLQRYSTFEGCLRGLLLNNNNIGVCVCAVDSSVKRDEYDISYHLTETLAPQKNEIIFINFINHLPPAPRGRHASCLEMSYSK